MAYPVVNLPNPLNKPVVAVNLYSTNIEKNIEYTNGIKSEKYTYIIDLYVPTETTGSGCMEFLSDISDLLLAENNGETKRVSKVSTVKYSSNARAFCAQLYLELSTDNEKNETPDGDKEDDETTVNIVVNDKVVAGAKKASVKVKNQNYNIYGYGESKPVDQVIMGREYIITMTNLSKKSNDIILDQLESFYIRIKTGTRVSIYGGCTWKETEESTDNKDSMLVTYTAISNQRTIFEEA